MESCIALRIKSWTLNAQASAWCLCSSLPMKTKVCKVDTRCKICFHIFHMKKCALLFKLTLFIWISSKYNLQRKTLNIFCSGTLIILHICSIYYAGHDLFITYITIYNICYVVYILCIVFTYFIQITSVNKYFNWYFKIMLTLN